MAQDPELIDSNDPVKGGPAFCEHYRVACPFCGHALLVGHHKQAPVLDERNVIYIHATPACNVFGSCDTAQQFSLFALLKTQEQNGQRVVN